MLETLLNPNTYIILGAGVFAFLIGSFAALRFFEGRYPTALFLVLYGSTIRFQKFRTMGTMVVRDNLINIILNKFEYMGEIGVQTMFLMPKANGFQKVYIAEYTNDYLYKVDKTDKGIKTIEVDVPNLFNPKEKTRKTVKFGDDTNGILYPLKFNNPAELNEVDIRTGKAIVERFKMNAQTNKDFLNGNNPVMTMIYTAIPLLLVVISLGIIMYLSILSMQETSFKMLEASGKILESLK